MRIEVSKDKINFHNIYNLHKSLLSFSFVVVFYCYYRFIDSFGYVSLFPVMLMLLSPDSPKLGYTLKQLQNPSVRRNHYGENIAESD